MLFSSVILIEKLIKRNLLMQYVVLHKEVDADLVELTGIEPATF